jgi:hypothetical protein
MARQVFFGYRRSDFEFARPLFEFLEGDLGRHEVCMDVDFLRPGDDFVAELFREVAESDILVVLAGPRWGTEDWRFQDRDFLRLEIEAALQLEKSIVLVLIEGARPPSSDALPASLEMLSLLRPVELRQQSFAADYEMRLRPIILHELGLARIKRARKRSIPQPEVDRPVVKPSRPPPTRKIFISYRREDAKPVATLIYKGLTQTFDKNDVFLDVRGIPLGEDFHVYLKRQVLSAQLLLAVIADRWLTATNPTGKRRLDDPDDFVRIEIEAALANDIKTVPLFVDGAKPFQAKDLPRSLQPLASRQGAFLGTGGDEFDTDLARLVADLQPVLATTAAAFEPI